MNVADFNTGKNACAVTAMHGLIAWLAYGTVEFVLCCVLPVAGSAEKTFSPWGWRLAGILFAAYAVTGIVLGGLAGAMLLRSARREQYVFAGTLTLVLAFLVNLVAAEPLARSENISLGVGLLVAAALGGAIFSQRWANRWSFLSNPWTVSLLLLAAPFVSRDLLEQSSAVTKLAASVACLGIIAALSWVTHWRGLGEVSWGRRMAVALVVMGSSAAVVGALSQRGMGKPGPAGHAPNDKPNVVLVMMDTVRADHLSVYGYERETTPFLKSFARAATVYQQAIAAADGTLPTHASVFTGLYPSWHGAHYIPPHHPWGYALEARFPTLAAVLAEKGYSTAGVVANYAYLSREFGLNRGFQLYRVQAPVFLSNWQRPAYLREGIRALLGKVFCLTEFDARTRRAEEINRDAFEFLDAGGRGRPFFLFVNYMDAHNPYLPPAPFDRRFPGKDPHFTEQHGREVETQVLRGRRALTEAERRHIVSQYDGGIAYIDSQIERLVAHLKQLGAYDNTMIIVAADHGEALGGKNLVDHAITSLYQNLVHVPLLIKYPQQRGAKSEPGLVSQVDVMPTVLDVLGYSAPGVLHGQSLLRPLPAERTVYSESFPGILFVQLNKRFDGVKRAAISGSSKLITWTKGSPEFYDLSRDPHEIQNLYEHGKEPSRTLASQLTAWAKTAPAPFHTRNRVDPASLQRLKSLGYAQ